MVEDTVVIKDPLTDEMIEAGAQLTQKLDELGLPIVVAMWFFEPETNRWKLLFASPRLSSEGPLVVYGIIQEARKLLGAQAEGLPFSSIGLLNLHNELVQKVRVGLQTGPGVSRVRVSRDVLDGRFIDDALIYRSAA